MDVMPFGKYDLLERIASGGMAEVYLARATGLAGFERRLVIKRIRDEHANDPRFAQSFVNEARISVHLNHPNIVQMYELGRVGEAWYIAMEHLHGRDLSRLRKVVVAKDGSVPAAFAVRVVADVCRALSYAHGRTDADGNPLGLVHRDVSPHNVVVTFAGEVKLVDFGIARLMHEPQSRGPSQVGAGKYAYMSPEQALGQDLDHRSDIYSAGVVLWELLAGHRLFQHSDPKEKLRRVRESVVPHPNDSGASVDDALWAITRKALSKDREDRHASAGDLEEDLRAWLFASRLRVERTHVAEVLRDAFPEEASRTSEDLHLHRLVADLDRIDLHHRTDPGDRTPSSSELPGRLMVAKEEQRPVVVLMIDVDGLTALSSRLSPEYLFRRRQVLLRWMWRIVAEHGGLLTAAVDDHVTALFGVPRSRGSDIHRALACALVLTRDVRSLRAKGLALELCIGVHAGDVAVRVGRRVRYAARGDTTRLARRLSAVADHGQVLASQRVVEAVEGEFDLHRGPAVGSRGGEPDLPSWIVRRRFSGLRRRGRGAWIRRAEEVEVVQQALLQLGQGRGSALALVGDAGTGKSRLLRELRELAGRRGLPFHGVHCSALGDARPVEPLRELLASLLGVEPDAPLSDLLAAADDLGGVSLPDRSHAALKALLGDKNPQAIGRHEVWEAMGSLLTRLANSRPLVVVLDDAHHLTAHTVQPLKRWITSLREVPVLLILAHHPPVPDELAKHLVAVPLSAMTSEQTARLAAEKLGVRQVDPSLLELLEGTCEGNPRYIEEMTKHLVEVGRIQVANDLATLQTSDAVEIPHNLQALVTARIDALDPSARGALQLAAIAGATFSEALLADAAGLEDPTPLVQELAAHNLVTRVKRTSDDWRLTSELVRTAALRGTMGVQRRDYHRLIAAAIERLSDDIDVRAAELMEHCALGGRPVDAARYAFRAGQHQERTQEYEAAERMYQYGLRYVAQIDNRSESWDAKVQGEATLYLNLGRVTLILGRTSAGQHALQIALDIASEAGLPWIANRAHLALGQHYHQRGKRALARAHIDQALASHLDDDQELERETLEAAATLAFDEGDAANAGVLWGKALTAAAGDPVASSRCELGLANGYLQTGDTEQARPLLAQALRNARLGGDRILEGRALNNLGLLHVWSDDFDAALGCFRTALELRESVGYQRGIVVNEHNIADVHFRKGDREKAMMGFARSRDRAESIGWARGEVLNEVFLRYLDGSGPEAIREAAGRARDLGDTETAAAGTWLEGRCHADGGDVDGARPHMETALLEAKSAGLRPLVLRIQAQLDGLSRG